MPGRIPDNTLEDILGRVDIVEMIASYIPLKRAGRNFKACCPFHHEKTASFMVSPDRQIYHCFGCGESGNAFKFLMRHERMEFIEAVQALARKAGVILPENKSVDPRLTSLTTQLYKVNELSTLFYESNLSSSQSIKAKEYLLNRKIKDSTIKEFKIGLAQDSWDSLINYLRSKSINLSLLDKSGLIINKDGGGYYDRFRNRIIFPIFDIKGRVLGFGARVMDNSLPKYVNSPETEVYTKGRHLYGLNLAKDAIRDSDSAVIVEGYLDFIMPYQEGLKNIVASLGTALTSEQARLLKRYTSNIIMVYDGDSAGELATLRSLDIFIEEEMSVRVVSLPKGLDPDSFVRSYGISSFKEKIADAKSLFEYKLGILKLRFNPKDAEGKAKIAKGMLETINKLKNAVLKSEYIKMLAEELDTKEEALLQEVGKIKVDRVNPQFSQPQRTRSVNINPTERLLVKLMLEETDLIHQVKGNLLPSDFKDERVSRIISTMFELLEQGKSIAPQSLMNHVDDQDLSQLLGESMFMPENLSQDHKEKVFLDCIQRLKSEKIKQRKQFLHDEIKTAQHLGDEIKLNRLMEEFHELIKKRG